MADLNLAGGDAALNLEPTLTESVTCETEHSHQDFFKINCCLLTLIHR